ncbi:hypothetical protein IAU60_005417 [Kwoniella sp. DSM 27419]
MYQLGKASRGARAFATASHAPLRILISGAGIAGPVCAWWLNKSLPTRPSITVLERSPELRITGQQLDLDGAALTIVRSMGLMEGIRQRGTAEAGTHIVDETNRYIASFPVTYPDGRVSPSMTNETEIARGELVKVFYDATRQLPGVDYTFGDHVTGMNEVDRGNPAMEVTLRSGQVDTYDLVIGADGLGSKIRRLMFPSNTPYDHLKRLGQYVAYFSIPHDAQRDNTWSRILHTSGGRWIWLRPDGRGLTRVFLVKVPTRGKEGDAVRAELDDAIAGGVEDQKRVLVDMFKDVGWEMDRILEGMKSTGDFYCQSVSQVKLPSWSNASGTATLLGDAGYCPSPISGMGTTAAVIGGRILAGEIARNPYNLPAALAAYDRALRPYIDETQSLVFGDYTPYMVSPQTATGVAVLRGIASAVSYVRSSAIGTRLMASGGNESKNQTDKIDLSVYR